MNKLISSLITIIVSVNASVSAQDLKIEAFQADATDITASTERRLDATNKPCALIKVYVVKDVKKAIGAIGDIVNRGSAKWVYLTEGSDQLILGFDNNQAIKINFEDYGVTEVRSLNTYSCVISIKGESQLDEVERFRTGTSYEIHGDYVKAAELYKQAADNGFSEAQGRLGLFYEKGWGVGKDESKAFSYYLKAAEQGDPDSQNNVGLYYIEGKGGVQRNSEKAIYWYTKAAESGLATAQSNLGYNYEVGDGVKKDINKAVYWYKKGAEGGNANAQNNYGRCLLSGLGVEKNVGQAQEWFLKAADQGQLMAIYHLGYSYEMEGDYIHAIYWYKIAAEKGDLESQKNLAGLYIAGKGVTKDLQKGRYWVEKAAAQGDGQALQVLQWLKKQTITRPITVESLKGKAQNSKVQGMEENDNNNSSSTSAVHKETISSEADDDIELQARNVYEETLKKVGPDGLINTSHIFVKLDNKASQAEQIAAKNRIDSIYLAIKKGADFASLAKKVSQDSGSASKGGVLGWTSRGQLLKEYEDAAFALQPGEMSGVVKTSMGYHIILMNERKPLEPYEFHRNSIIEFIKKRKTN